jgi:hypothetical protein
MNGWNLPAPSRRCFKQFMAEEAASASKAVPSRPGLCIINLDQPFFSFAMFVSALAYPWDVEKRDEYARTILASGSQALKRGPASPYARIWKLKPRRIKGIFSVSSRHLARRMKAAVFAERIIVSKDAAVAQMIGTNRKLPPAKNITQATNSEMLRTKLGRKWHQADLMSRIWTPSKPVLHMAIAFLRLSDEEWMKTLASSLAGNGEWIDAALDETKFWKGKLPKFIPSWNPAQAMPILVLKSTRASILI